MSLNKETANLLRDMEVSDKFQYFYCIFIWKNLTNVTSLFGTSTY